MQVAHDESSSNSRGTAAEANADSAVTRGEAKPADHPQKTNGAKKTRRNFNEDWTVLYPWVIFKDGDEKTVRGMYCKIPNVCSAP